MVNYANRGKYLESLIIKTNKIYKIKEVAIIDKIATPVNYNTRTGRAFYEGKSTVDFIGCLNNGKMVAFDAKQTKQKSFPFSNVTEHQEKYLKSVNKLNGIAFILLYFSNDNVYYKLDIEDYVRYKNNSSRKSIPLSWFEDNCKEIISKNGYPIHYLEEYVN